MVDTSGLDELLEQLEDALEDALDDAAEHAVAIARAHAPGDLARRIRVKRTAAGREIVADAPYAEFVEAGRGAVEARDGKVLHFVVNGRDVFARRVGPAKPHPFMALAAEDLRANGHAIIERALSKVDR